MPSQPTTECPTCRRPVRIPPDDQPMGTYPFCSERCKLIDLGRWFDGSYQIAAVEPDEDTGDAEPSRPGPGEHGEGGRPDDDADGRLPRRRRP